jgi:hypothetical protein
MSMIELIRDYTSTTATAVAQLRRECGVEDLLQGWHQRRYPQHGKLSDGAEYHFHGIGCCVERPEVDVDLDFGPGGRADGFDAWRLWRFAKQFPTRYPDLQERDALERALQALVDEGVVVASGVEHDHLLYLRG